MWQLLAGFISLILGVGGTIPDPFSTVTNPVGPTPGTTIRTCYTPDPNQTLVLTTANFSNVTDPRPTLNPAVWAGKPSTFNTDASCKGTSGPMNGLSSRTFIQVRKDVRISSCKTDELAGPYGSGQCTGWGGSVDAAKSESHRGSCDVAGYTDLRKIADAEENGQPVEIFWNPFSYNVSCHYEKNNNCGPGNRTYINLKDFIYVLRKRDAFDSTSNKGCPVLWDAGSLNLEACSHYFEVYLAKDTYESMQMMDATDGKEPAYFLKQIVENCQEETTYHPAALDNLEIPPQFIASPFLKQSDDPSLYIEGKIEPSSDFEKSNYNYFIYDPLRKGSFFDASTSESVHLLKVNSIAGPPTNICTASDMAAYVPSISLTPIPSLSTIPTTTPATMLTSAPDKPADCNAPLGSITIKDDQGASHTFTVYTQPATPQTFYFSGLDDPSKLHVYTITSKNYNAVDSRNSTLQLRALPFITQNEWTWATPWCKPAVYLYPEKPTELNVRLKVDGKITVSDPAYNESTGWNVKALPDGTLEKWGAEQLDQFPYLYYEADLLNVPIPQEGWVVGKSEVQNRISTVLNTIGFNDKEISDFLAYWLPKLNEKPYYFITLLPEDVINTKEALTFSVKPETLIRTRVVFEGLDAPVSVKPPATIPTHKRVGFTVTDWGGTLVGKSCTDVTVK